MNLLAVPGDGPVILLFVSLGVPASFGSETRDGIGDSIEDRIAITHRRAMNGSCVPHTAREGESPAALRFHPDSQKIQSGN